MIEALSLEWLRQEIVKELISKSGDRKECLFTTKVVRDRILPSHWYRNSRLNENDSLNKSIV